MKYKILLGANNTYSTGTMYYHYYQTSPSEGDWSTTDKTEAITKIEELLETYGTSEISVVIELDITNTIDIPDLPTEASGNEEESSEGEAEEIQ